MIFIPRILFVLVVCFISSLSLQAGEKDSVPAFRLGTASEGGTYHRFANELIANLRKRQTTDFRLVNISTEGSVDNLKRIRRGALDLAIVQNDIAYYIYEGRHSYLSFHGFSTVLPLFTEYIQVLVRRDSDIHILGDLRNRMISIGPQRSGSYHNALDLMREIGLRSGINYELRNLPVGEAVDQLFSGEIDAVMYTGAELPVRNSTRLRDIRIIPISREIAASLKGRSSYYSLAEIRIPSDTDSEAVPTIAVRAYLVASNRLGAAQVGRIVEAMADIWPELMAEGRYRLGSLEEIARRSPVPLHAGVKQYLRRAGYIETDYRAYLWLALVIMLAVGAVVWAHRTTSGYDRLGNICAGGGTWRYWFASHIARAWVFVLVVAIFTSLTVTLVFTIRYFEMDYARQMNIDNTFANVDFSDALLWMFMFMGAGEPGDMFPLSTPGKILVTILPFLGITSMLGLFFVTMERRRRLSAERKRGTVTRDVQDHVLVCGWNEKVPGLVWALTNKEAPEQKKVVIVAELEGDMPLERYDFDPDLVSYYRGDSADLCALERAHVGNAEAAVVVAGVRKRKGRNIRSVLSVMALKAAYEKNKASRGVGGKDLFVAAEMIYDRNQVYFEASQVDAVVPSENIADYMAALCCTSPSIVDYMLDMFTYDEHAEIYSIPVNRIQVGWRAACCGEPIKQIPLLKSLAGWLVKCAETMKHDSVLVGMQLVDVRRLFAARGVNVIGLIKASYHRERGQVKHEFSEKGPYKLLLDADSKGRRIESGDTLLYIADNYDDIHIPKAEWSEKQSFSTPPGIKMDALWPPVTRRVLLVGDLERCLRVRKLLEEAPWVETSILTEESKSTNQPDVYCGELSILDSWKQAGLAETDVVLVLANSNAAAREADLMVDQGEVDARAIFTARFARKYSTKLASDRSPGVLQVVAEMGGRNSQSLFKEAGVDVVIPGNLLVERVLTKLIYSRGLVCDFLMALLSTKDRVHLYSLCLENDKDGNMLGKTFDELMEIMPEGFQLMGLLPGDENNRKDLINLKGDFECHFIAHPAKKKPPPYQSRVGDELIAIVDHKYLSE